MKSKVSPGEIANLLSGCRAESTDSKITSKLVEHFQPLVSKIASSYPYFWQDDFIQEGTLGLLSAAKKYPASANPIQFVHYATTAIRNRMNRFLDAVVTRQPDCIEPICYTLDDDEKEDVLLQITNDANYAVNASLKIDFKYQFSSEGLSKNGFTKKEAEAFNLHFIEGYGVTDVAEQIGVSVPQSSKIIAKVRKKVLLLLQLTQPSNLN